MIVFGKSGTNLNHEKFWNVLSSRVIDNKPYDYYPRGRVEISNGIDKISVSFDGSNHYKSKLI